MTDFLQVSTALPARQDAIELARSIVEARLAAGAQVIGPVVSAFWHQGDFGVGEEWVLVLKTTAGRYSELERHLVDHHPWKSPEVIAVPVAGGSPAYLDWVRRTVGGD